jgi:NADPH:quinone reductase-like Zn-dependent oxidoreductase
MKYQSIVVTQLGGPEVLQQHEFDLRPPLAGEARLRVIASAVCRPDVTVRRGTALYSGTPLGKKPPFIPGYAVIGIVEAVGPHVREVNPGDRVGALTVSGGYSEYLYWKSSRLMPVPDGVDPAEAVTLILNYLVAYQTMHRVARARAGEKTLIIGASGGIGTAFLQLGKLANLEMVGLASTSKHASLHEYGAVAVDYHSGNWLEALHQLAPDGFDIILDGVMSRETVQGGLSLLRRGGRMVCFGEPSGFSVLFSVLWTWLKMKRKPEGKTLDLYGTSTYFLGDRQPYLEDWAILFKWLQEGRIRPVIAQRFPILDAARANALLETGDVVGNLVLLAPELT